MIEMLIILSKGPWKLGIGDPTVLGWATTVAYLIAAGLCGAYALRARKTVNEGSIVHRPSNSVFWWSLAVFMLLMGFNKQLDLQVLVLQTARRVSKEQGWFAERDAVRKGIILSFAFVSVILMAWLGWTCRRVWRRYILAVSGIALLVIFVLIRASGHRLMILGYRPGRFPMYDILEIGGIVCVGVSAWMELRRCGKQTR
jgi:hypothetical protein